MSAESHEVGEIWRSASDHWLLRDVSTESNEALTYSLGRISVGPYPGDCFDSCYFCKQPVAECSCTFSDWMKRIRRNAKMTKITLEGLQRWTFVRRALPEKKMSGKKGAEQ